MDALNPARNFSYQFDASGNMTNCVGGGESFALAYDEDNRVTTLNWTNGTTNKSIPNRDDVFGRRIERTVNGRKTSYALDLSGDMERILFEKDDVGNFSYFIHAPDLCYRIDQTNGATCFHADAQANVIALTGPAKRISPNMPTRHMAAHSARRLSISNLQPVSLCRLARRDGEVPGLYFMRARYYSSEAGGFLSTDPVKNIFFALAAFLRGRNRLRLPIRYEAGRKPALRRRRYIDHAPACMAGVA